MTTVAQPITKGTLIKMILGNMKPPKHIGAFIVRLAGWCWVILIFTGIMKAHSTLKTIKLGNTNVSIILGAALLSIALGCGLNSISVFNKACLGFYSQQYFEEGQMIEIAEIKGSIVSITNLSVCMRTTDEKVISPADLFMNQHLNIFD